MFREILVPVGIIAVLASLLLPLPTMIIDFLLVVNLIGALVLLTSSLYVPNPVKLSTLPTLLLLATLFRLALNISTTRLILGAGDAGFMIKTFGELLMQNNIIVGAVVFLVLTLVQLIVIAKGAERVAEVSARFTLDALPGKQMSIDADVRSGLLSMDEAKERRNDLQIESRFYGALDGAMKFIKGDAVAGIVITVINIIGGFAVGSFLIGLDMGTAMNKYTLLTVGDGLLSQIPALLNSIAAGIVVTRVVKDDKRSLVSELPEQLAESNKARVLVGIVGLLLAAIPGTPILPFVLLSTLLLGSAAVSANKKNKESKQADTSDGFSPKTPPLIEFHMSKQVLMLFTDREVTEKYLVSVLDTIYEQTGLILTMPNIKADEELETGVRVFLRGVETDSFDCGESWEVFQEKYRESLLAFVHRHKVELIDDITTRRIIDSFDNQAPELVSHVIPNVATVTQLTSILRELLREDISIRNIDVIMQTISENSDKIEHERLLLEEVRIALGRMIAAKYQTHGKIAGYRVDPVIDITLAQSERTQETLQPEYMEQIRLAFATINYSRDTVFFVSRQARKLLFEFMQAYRVPATILAFEELPQGIELDELGVVQLSQEYAEEVVGGYDA